MSSRPVAATLPHRSARWTEVVNAASRRLTWRVLASTVIIACALEAWTTFESALNQPDPTDIPITIMQERVSAAIINVSMAFAIMFATLVADEVVARGARRLWAYSRAVLVGSAAGAVAQYGIHRWLHLPTRSDGVSVALDVTAMQPVAVFCEYLIWGSIIVFVYVSSRTALRASARMHEAQVAKARAQRRTLESRLQALQARVEPQFLLNTLAKVRSLYDEDPRQGGRLLQDLIVYLRAALPQLRGPTSTLDRELELVGTYLSIMRVHMGDRLTIVIDAPPALEMRAMPFPPMILLPLVDHVLTVGSAAFIPHPDIRVAARAAFDRLRIEIGATGGDPAAESAVVLEEIRDRLRALYGESGNLRIDSSMDHGTRAVMEVPYGSTDGDPR